MSNKQFYAMVLGALALAAAIGSIGAVSLASAQAPGDGRMLALAGDATSEGKQKILFDAEGNERVLRSDETEGKQKILFDAEGNERVLRSDEANGKVFHKSEG